MTQQKKASQGENEQNRFLDEIKIAGISIKGERDLAERLGEVFYWKTAFTTMACHGERIGIALFPKTRGAIEKIGDIMASFGFSGLQKEQVTAALAKR